MTALGALRTFAEYTAEIVAPNFGQRNVLLGCADSVDLLVGMIRRARNNLYLDQAEPEVYSAHGANSSMPRVSGESNEGYRGALLRRFDAWAQSGARREMYNQLARLGHTFARVVTWNDLFDAGRPGAFGGLNPDPLQRFTNYWFLVLQWPVLGVNMLPARWGGGKRWGEKPDGAVWGGVGIAPRQIEDIRQVILKWKPEHTSCRFIVTALGRGFTLNPDYTWSGPSIVYPVNDPWEFDALGRAKPFYNQNPDTP